MAKAAKSGVYDPKTKIFKEMDESAIEGYIMKAGGNSSKLEIIRQGQELPRGAKVSSQSADPGRHGSARGHGLVDAAEKLRQAREDAKRRGGR